MGFDVFDIVAIILGVLFTIRKLDAQRREPEEFSHVDRALFLSWRAKETRLYAVGMIACFAKVLAKLVIVTFVSDRVSYSALRAMGATVDLSWVVLVIFTLVGGYRLALLRTRLRIVLGGFIVAESSEISAELKEAIATMKSGDVARAEYLLQQVALDADESLKAIATYYLGECYLLQGKVEEAKDAFQEAVELDPSLSEPQRALAKLRGKDS